MVGTGIFLGYAYSHVLEWFMHRLLHFYGKKKDSLLSHHMRSHHKVSRINDYYEPEYSNVFFTQEAKFLLALAYIHLFLLPIMPLFYFSLIFNAYSYYRIHRKSHMNIKWTKQYLPWHYEHHMGKNPHKFWGVRSNFIDRMIAQKSKQIR